MKFFIFLYIKSIFLLKFIVLSPYFLDSYGIAIQICKISDEKLVKGSDSIENSVFFIMKTLFYYLPIWTVLLSNFFFYIKCLKFLKSALSHPKHVTSIKNLLFYPASLMFCYILMIVYRLITSFCDFNNEIFVIFAVFLSTLNGLLDSFIFFKHPQVLKSSKNKGNSIEKETEESVSENSEGLIINSSSVSSEL